MKMVISILAGFFFLLALPLIWLAVFGAPLPVLSFMNNMLSPEHDQFFAIGGMIAVVVLAIVPWMFGKGATVIKVIISVVAGVFLFLCLPLIWPALFGASWSFLPFMNKMLESRAYSNFFIVGSTLATIADGIIPWFTKK